MQYSLLVFEIVFYNSCNITGVAYKGWVGGRGWGVVGVGEQAKGEFSLFLDHRQGCCVLSRQRGCIQTTG